MLNKKQLEDASKCYSLDCNKCINDNACKEDYNLTLLEDSAKTALVYREMLEQLIVSLDCYFSPRSSTKKAYENLALVIEGIDIALNGEPT